VTSEIFLNDFRYLGVSWNGDSLISPGNKFHLSEVKNETVMAKMQMSEKVSFLVKLT